MRTRKLPAALALGVTAAAIAFLPFGGAGAVTDPVGQFSGYSGGTQISALGTAISSDLTAKSSINTTATTASNSNATLSVTASTLLNTGTVTSSETVSPLAGGGQLVSKARVEGLSALGGLIRATAVESTSTASVVDGATSGDSVTTFVDLRITGVNLPVNINKNTTVQIPNVALVQLNVSRTLKDADGSIRTGATGLYIKLLSSFGNAPAGAQIWLTPTYAAIVPPFSGTGLAVGGRAYGTQITSDATSSVQVNSGPTAYLGMARGGTNGSTISNKTAAANLPGAATVGAVTTSGSGTVSDTMSTSKMGVEIAGVNLLNGLIKADALKGEATATKSGSSALVATTSATFVNLVIAGQPIPVNVSPNTVINIANVGKVTINAQVKGASGAAVELLDVLITTQTLGLPVGAHIYVGVAVAQVVLS
jgi:hypothetical protein